MRIITLTVALLLGLMASAAHAGQGIFEAPMVNTSTLAEVPGSEGKIERDGAYKVEIPSADPGTYSLCLHYAGGNMVLGDPIVLAEADELKFEGDLATMTLVAPYFGIHPAADCTTAATYMSGLSVTD